MPICHLRRATACAILIVAMAGSSAVAQGLEDALKGFGGNRPAGQPAGKPEPDSESVLPDWLALGGAVSQDLAWNYAHDAPPPGQTDHRGLSGFRSRLDLEADVNFSANWRARVTGYAFHDSAYRIQGRDGFTDAFLDAYEQEAELGEAYLQGKLRRDFDIRLGRQIVVWGKSDNIRVTDILNPLDLRTPGRTDIADLRLPVTMSKLDYFFGDWNLGAIVVHELRYSKSPVPGSDFFPGLTPLPPHDPDSGFGEQEYALALNGTFRGWDISFYGAYVFEERARIAATQAGPRQSHDRIWMAGASANVASGNWLLKGEAAYFDGMRFTALPNVEFARVDALAGLEYSGFTDTSISVEAALRRILDFDARIGGAPDLADEEEVETALRISRKFLNETLEVGLVVSTFWLVNGNGGFQRLQITYDWTDSVEVSGGVINFDAADSPRLAGIGDNDRIFTRIKYRF